MRTFLWCLALIVAVPSTHAGEVLSVDVLRREIESLRKRMDAEGQSQELQRQIDGRIGQIFDSNQVRTKEGTLRIGGLLQVWAYSIQNDNVGFTDIQQVIPSGGSTAARNEEADNDSMRIRRAEIRFALDIHENIAAYVTLDPAREATAYPSLPDNQGSAIVGDHDAVFFNPCLCAGFIDDPRQIGAGFGRGNRILQEAYINYHGVLPRHDVSIGQFKRRLGEEGSRDSANLDFVERAMITQHAELRDLGVQLHGDWIDGKVQYWLGLFDGAGTAFQPRSNRSDDNDEKDFVGTLQATPLRDHERFGTLELGYSAMFGTGGESAGHQPGTTPINGLNRNRTAHAMQYAWGHYAPAGPVRGWWVRGEWGQYRDRFDLTDAASGVDVFSVNPGPFGIQGWYVSTGYRLGQHPASRLSSAWRNLEFAFRYEAMQNVFYHDLVLPERRFDVFKTQVITAGVNYYLSGQHAKLQLNYNWVVEEDRGDKDDRQLREVRNDNVVLNFQLAF